MAADALPARLGDLLADQRRDLPGADGVVLYIRTETRYARRTETGLTDRAGLEPVADGLVWRQRRAGRERVGFYRRYQYIAARGAGIDASSRGRCGPADCAGEKLQRQ